MSIERTGDVLIKNALRMVGYNNPNPTVALPRNTTKFEANRIHQYIISQGHKCVLEIKCGGCFESEFEMDESKCTCDVNALKSLRFSIISGLSKEDQQELLAKKTPLEATIGFREQPKRYYE